MSSYSVRVKICGVTSVASAVQAAEAGADALGLVFYESSVRHLANLALAREIALAVGPFVTLVGLFVDPEPSYVEQVITEVPLGLLQFHGDETADFCDQFRRPYIKALRMRPSVDVLANMAKYPAAQGILLDAYQPGVPGGTGETFDWDRVPSGTAKPVVLAGGLTAKNVSDAVARVAPWAVDVSGGVECSAGQKAPDLVSEFIRRAKGSN